MVQSEDYVLALYRYIELNPVRANMVDEPSQYPWSSYQINALGKESTLCMPHPLYAALGRDAETRQAEYRALFKHHIDCKLIDEIRKTLNKGLALGSDRFKAEIETLTGRRVTEGKRGRPLGWRKDKNSCDL